MKPYKRITPLERIAMIRADIKRRRDAGEIPAPQKSQRATPKKTELLERYAAVKDSPEYAAIIATCTGCEHFAKGRHCVEAVRTCGCAAGSVLGMSVKSKACPLGKWEAPDVQAIIERSKMGLSKQAQETPDAG